MSELKERFINIDRVAIYKQLVSIKPFFEDVKKIKSRKAAAKDAYPTERKVTLVESGGVWFEISGGAIEAPNEPRFLLY